jgi:type VI secretion system secreted protein Hcp
MMKRWLGAMFTMLFLLAIGQADAALDATMTITGAKQGPIEGSVTQAGREGSIEVNAVLHNLIVPQDATAGLPTGRHQHEPLTVLIPIDKATPLLYAALVTGEALIEVVIRFWRPAATGQQEQFFTIELVNARIVGVRLEQLDTENPNNASVAQRGYISFAYERIRWTYELSGVSYEDAWLAGAK